MCSEIWCWKSTHTFSVTNRFIVSHKMYSLSPCWGKLQSSYLSCSGRKRVCFLTLATYSTCICIRLMLHSAPDPNTPEACIPAADLPRCEQPGCGGLLRPHVVWFGEPLFHDVLQQVNQTLDECDLCLLVRFAEHSVFLTKEVRCCCGRLAPHLWCTLLLRLLRSWLLGESQWQNST